MGWLLQLLAPIVLDRVAAYFKAAGASAEQWQSLQNFITTLQSHGLKYVSDVEQFNQQDPSKDPQPQPPKSGA